MNKAVLLVNLGTPDSPSVKDVRKYLRQFLMDPLVISMPLIKRWILVNLIIAPLRAPKSAESYHKLWTEKGSPLLFHLKDLKKSVNESNELNVPIEIAMRYGNPSIKSVIDRLYKQGIKEILCVPTFPQFAEATSASVINEVKKRASVFKDMKLNFIESFFNDPGFISAFAENVLQCAPHHYDLVLMSFHGLPLSQIKRFGEVHCSNENCECEIQYKNEKCYKAQCFETARLLANQCQLNKDQYKVCFQSRLGKEEWLKPYAEDLIKELPDKNIKRILVVSPAFVADCLETTIEIGQEYKEFFIAAGGESLDLVPSLNSNRMWVKALVQILKEN